ncbi:MAG: hypothetical protein EA412_01625 [Chitinophagaceae bacterium]|nr:MAG: hypothetical protein EA412_01625 [Chitinophagaceae bacterium]
MNKNINLILLGVLIILLSGITQSCKTSFDGDEDENLPPNTFTVVDTIIRLGDERLTSEVHIRWWGDDPDGYVVGYEFTFDDVVTPATDWSFTEKRDSVFILAPPPGNDTIDFRFSVRAVDNEGARDPSPASVVYPVKNSPPVIQFQPAVNRPVKTFPAVRFFWEADDPDGKENLLEIEVYWNDTLNDPFIVPATTSGAIFRATSPDQSISEAQVFLNNSLNAENANIEGMILDDYNQLIIRSVDQSLAKSSFVYSDSVFIKRVNSSVLLVNAYGNQNPTVESFYANNLTANGINVFDTLHLFEQSAGAFTQLSSDNPTQAMVFDFFETIIWFGDNAQNSLSLAQRTTNPFFESGGKLMLILYFSSLFDEQSQFLDFTPIQSLVIPGSDTTLTITDTTTFNPIISGYPPLQSTSFLSVVRPINLILNASPIYSANISARHNPTFTFSPWTGNSTIIGKRTNSQGKTNFIISTIELHRLNGNNNAVDLFEKLLLDEFEL